MKSLIICSYYQYIIIIIIMDIIKKIQNISGLIANEL